MARGAKPLERTVQRNILAYLKVRGFATAHIPNGAVLAGDAKARAMQVNALKANGMRPGFPDLCVMHSLGRVGFLEVKREGEKLRPEQEQWRDALATLGHKYAVVRSVEDVRETLLEWGW